MTNNGKTLAKNQAATNSLRATILRNGNSLTERNKLVIKENILTDLQDGADINAALAESHYSLNIEFLEATRDLLLDHPKSNLSPDNFLEFVLQKSQNEGDFTGAKKLIETALDHGANINSILKDFRYSIELAFLEATKDLLLDHPKSNLSHDKFLELALRASVTKYDSETQKHVTDSEKIKLQGTLIKYALDHGAVINTDADEQDISLEVLSAHKDLLLEHPTLNLTSNSFLKLIIKSTNDFELPNINMKIYLLKEAILSGANVNIQIKGKMGCTLPLDSIKNKDISSFLQGYGAQCSSYSYIAKDFFQHAIFSKHPFGFAKIYKNIISNLNAPREAVNKIPYKIHHVWLTHPLSPKELDPLDIETVIKNHQLLEKNNKTWEHIIWTNQKSLLPHSISLLEEHNAKFKYNIEIREIQEFDTHFILFKKVQELIEKELWGLSSDIVRYAAIKHFGGVYTDLDFKINRDIEGELYKYDFFAQDFVNNFFAARANHPIISATLNKIESLFMNPPSYISNLHKYDYLTRTVLTTFYPFGLSYLDSSNKENNTDIIFPPNDMNENTEDWLRSDRPCSSLWEFLDFTDHVGICVSEDLTIGSDRTNGQYLTWLKPDDTCYI